MKDAADYLTVGFIILIPAFFLSLMTVGMIRDSYHIVIALDPNLLPNNRDFNQQNYNDYIMWTLLCGIAPVSSALVFLTNACVKAGKIPTEEFRSWTWLFFTVAFMTFGFFISIGSYRTYLYTSDEANRWQITHIIYALQTIFALQGFVGALWIVTGAVFIAIFRIGRRLNRKAAQEENLRTM